MTTITKQYVFECKLKGHPIIVWGEMSSADASDHHYTKDFAVLKECGVIKADQFGGGIVMHDLILMRVVVDNGQARRVEVPMLEGAWIPPRSPEKGK